MVIGGDVESVVLGIMIDDETGSGTTRNEFTSFSHQVALDKDQKQLVRYVSKGILHLFDQVFRSDPLGVRLGSSQDGRQGHEPCDDCGSHSAFSLSSKFLFLRLWCEQFVTHVDPLSGSPREVKCEAVAG